MEIEELAFHSQTDKLSTFSLWIERERDAKFFYSKKLG